MAIAIEMLERVKDAIIHKDFEALEQCYGEQSELVTPSGKFTGRSAIRKSYENWLAHFSDLKAEVPNKLEGGGQAVEEWKMTAVSSAEIPAGAFGERIPANGEELTVHCANIAAVEGGIIAKHHVYYDQKEIMDQLGMSGRRI